MNKPQTTIVQIHQDRPPYYRLSAAKICHDSQAVAEPLQFAPETAISVLHRIARIAAHIPYRHRATTRIGKLGSSMQCIRGRWKIARSRPAACYSTTAPLARPQALRSGSHSLGYVDATSRGAA